MKNKLLKKCFKKNYKKCGFIERFKDATFEF